MASWSDGMTVRSSTTGIWRRRNGTKPTDRWALPWSSPIRPRPPGTYTLKLAVYDPATLAQLSATGPDAAGNFVTLGQVQLTSAAEPADPEQLPIEAQIDSAWEGVGLLGRGALPAEVSPGDRLAFDLYWQAPAQTGSAGLPDLKTRLTLEPVGIEVPAGVALSHETTPVRGYAAAEWEPGEVLRGRQNWQLAPELPTGDYRLTLQMIGPGGETSPPVELGAIKVAGRPHVFAPPAEMDSRVRRSDRRFRPATGI